MKSNKQIIIDAIIKRIEQGDAFGTTLKLNGTKWHLARTTFVRYWKIAQEQHTAKQQAIKKEIAIVDKEAAINARKKAIMSAEERKEFLTSIIKAKTDVKAVGKMTFSMLINPDGTKEILTISDKLRALSELNKMDGDYAPTKVATTDSKGNDVKPVDLSKYIPFETLMKIEQESGNQQ